MHEVASGLAIGIDVGGTKVAAGVVDPEGRVLARARRPSPTTDVRAVEDAVTTCVDELRGAHPAVVAVGVGAAGFVDAAQEVVLFAPNLAWRDEPLRARLAARLGLPVTVDNDANAAGWAEHRFGAGRGVRDLVVLTIGTGIGGAVLLGGRLHRGSAGVAGEPGHVRVVPDGRRCGCGNRGCWEQYCSGRALVVEAREVAGVRPLEAARLLELADGAAGDITGPVVTEAAREGDPVALECFGVVGRWLGQGLADLAALLDPERFVIGGGVIDAGDLLLGPAREEYAARLVGRGTRPLAPIVAAALGPEAGLVGAADLARLHAAVASGSTAA